MLSPIVVQNADLLRAVAGWSGDQAPRLMDISRAVGRDKSNVNRTLGLLIEAGAVEAEGEPRAYGVTEAGRAGLAALDVAEGRSAPAASAPEDHVALVWAEIAPDPDNPRRDWDSEEAQADLDELAADILANDLLQNPLVRLHPDGDAAAEANGVRPTHMLIAGERRWRAIGRLVARGDWPKGRRILCKVKEVDELGRRLAALAENLKRRQLNPIEEALAFQALVEAGVKTAELAQRTNVTQRMVQQRMQLLQLPEDKRAEVAAGRLTIEGARHEVQRLNGLKLELPPMELLALAELYTRQQREPFDDGYGSGKAQIADTLSAALQSLDRQKLVYVSHRSSVQGGRSIAWLPYGVPARLAHSVEGFDTDRDAALDRLRREALGDEIADAVRAAGRYACEWLNAPFEVPADVVAEIEQRQREQAEEAQRRRDTEAFAQETSAARLRDVMDLQRQLAECGRIGAVREEFEQSAAMLRAPLPWFYDVDQNQVYDAVGAQVRTLNFWQGAYGSDDRALRQLMVTAVNAAAGLPTPAERPVPGGPRGAFERAMAARYIELDPALSQIEALAEATERLDDYLEDHSVEFGDGELAWDEAAAVAVADEYTPVVSIAREVRA